MRSGVRNLFCFSAIVRARMTSLHRVYAPSRRPLLRPLFILCTHIYCLYTYIYLYVCWYYFTTTLLLYNYSITQVWEDYLVLYHMIVYIDGEAVCFVVFREREAVSELSNCLYRERSGVYIVKVFILFKLFIQRVKRRFCCWIVYIQGEYIQGGFSCPLHTCEWHSCPRRWTWK